MRHFLLLLGVLICLNGFAGPAAGDTAEVEAQLQRTVDQALEVLRRPDLEQNAKKEAIVDLVEPLFDFSLMAKLVLGRKHWSALSLPEQERFEALFVERLKSSYIDKIDLYSGETIGWRPALLEGKDRIQVPAVLVSQEKEIVILYKLYRGAGGWKIYDVEVQGISIVATFRSQFDQILKTGTAADLFRELEKPHAN